MFLFTEALLRVLHHYLVASLTESGASCGLFLDREWLRIGESSGHVGFELSLCGRARLGRLNLSN